MVRLARLGCALLAPLALAGCFGGDDSPDAVVETSPIVAPDTRPALRYETVPGGSVPDASSAFVDDVRADEVVTADEIDAAYQRYVECLAEGGGTGRYAYDIELRTGLVIDWDVDPDDPGPVDRDELSAACSRRYLGDLTRHFHRANPPASDVVEDQQASITRCVEAVSPAAAANLPGEVTVNTTGEGTSIGELQLDASGLFPEGEASEELIAGVNACFASLGAEWQEFG